MSRDKQFDRKRMLGTIDGLIEELNDTDIRDIDGGYTPIVLLYAIICYGILPISY